MNDHSLCFIDSTLREGMQAFGFNPSLEVKIKIAHHLDRLGCDIIELGHPGVAPSIFETARVISSLNLRAEGLVHSLLKTEEIDLAHETGAQWIGFFLSINPDVIDIKYGDRFSQLVGCIPSCVNRAHQLGLKVRFTCEDASRTSIQRLSRFYEILRKAKVDLLGYADTTGALIPSQARRIFRILSQSFPDSCLHFHGHNDRGLALANAMEALEAGWDSFDASVLGIGERAGIAPLTESAILLSENFDKNHDLTVCHDLDELVWDNLDLCKYSKRRFAHKAGLHSLATLERPSAYESLTPQSLNENRISILSQFSGTRSVLSLAQSLGLAITTQEARSIVKTIKQTNLEFWKPDDIINYIDSHLGPH